MIHTLKRDSIEAFVANQTLTWVGSEADPAGGPDLLRYSSLGLEKLEAKYDERLDQMKLTGPPQHVRWIERIKHLSGDQARLALRHLAHGNHMEHSLCFAEGS